jgi:hypothetical protein
MAVIVTAVSTPLANDPSKPPEATLMVPDGWRIEGARDVGTSLIVLCFPGAGCIVCHNGYCEYTSRM